MQISDTAGHLAGMTGVADHTSCTSGVYMCVVMLLTHGTIGKMPGIIEYYNVSRLGGAWGGGKRVLRSVLVSRCKSRVWTVVYVQTSG